MWQDENLDRVIRYEEEFLGKVNYIANNPVKANLSEGYEDYKWLNRFVPGSLKGLEEKIRAPKNPCLKYLLRKEKGPFSLKKNYLSLEQ